MQVIAIVYHYPVFVQIRYILLFGCCCLGFCLAAQVHFYEKITIENGLSQGMIFNTLQTRDGFLWFATKDGLNRYDGYNFNVYANDPFNPFSLGENTCYALFEDSRGWLWAGLESRGVDLLDPSTGLFHHFPLNFGNARLFEGANTNKILETPDGAIWLSQSRGGLIRIAVPADWKNGLPAEPDLSRHARLQAIELPLQGEAPDHPIPESIINLTYLENSELLVTSSQSQYIVNTKTFAVRQINTALLEPGIAQFVMNTGAPDGEMWFFQVQEKTQQRVLWRIAQGEKKSFPLPTGNSLWTRLAAGVAGHIWFVMNEKWWDLAPGEDLDITNPDFEIDVPTSCLSVDRSGNLWIGTPGYGLRKINPVSSKFHAGAAGESIRGIWSNGPNYYCKRTFDICAYDPARGTLAGTSAFPGATSRQINLVFEPSGAAWLLCKIPDTNTGLLFYYPKGANAYPERRYSFNAKLTISDPMLRARDGQIWIASEDGRLIRFNPRNERFESFDFGYLFGKRLNAVLPVALAEDRDGAIWLGTQLGLVKCMPASQGVNFQLILSDPGNRSGLNNNSIACILPDEGASANRLWIGTKGGGINIMDVRTGECRHITTADGLLNNVVYGILPGNRAGEFWCSTNRGLAKIVTGEHAARTGSTVPDFKITTFTSTFGLQDNEFNTAAYCKNDWPAESGRGVELLFGGINGLNRFYPDELRLDTTPPPVYIVGLEVNHRKAKIAGSDSEQNYVIKVPVERLDQLDLNYDQNNLSIEFAALDFTDPSKNRYRYRLEGLDADWVETGNHRFAHFSQLAPGWYTFHVEGSNGESAWRKGKSLILVVHPPWWRSGMAKFGYLLLLALAGWRAYLFQLRRVQEREQLAFEQREKERIQALEQMKTNFFANVTHEFRTPLTLIIEPLRQLLKKPDDPDRDKKIALAEKNSRQLLGLVNELLDLAKLQSGSMVLYPRLADFRQIVRGVCEYFSPLAEKEGVQLIFDDPNDEQAEFMFDPEKVELVLNNLLSNALKFTPAGGRVQVQLSRDSAPDGTLQLPAAGPFAVVRVSDSGIGIQPDDLTRIFGRFYQAADRQETGTGIGLSVSKELAELMGGDILAESKPGQGSVFTFYLPARLAPAPPDENIATDTAGVQTAALAEQPLVLLVEDNAELRAFIRQSIGPQWQVVEAPDGEEGLRLALELLPDLVISDIMMPGKDGYELCRALKTNELTAHVPVILLTARSAVESKLKGLRTGADDYLTKPFHTEELLARMTNLVEMRRKLRERFSGQPVAQVLEVGECISGPDADFLQKFTQILEQHLSDETLGVEGFAQKMFVSRSQLHRKLKAVTGRNATEFIRDFRLERAHALLRQGGGRVAEIAFRVGFGNEKYFSTAFREKYGIPPSQVQPR